MADRLTGTIVRIRPEGYGFCHVAGLGDYYIHVSEMRDMAAWQEGAQVTFSPGPSKNGKSPAAHDVTPVEV
jgi:cold shock CspA family protein